MELRRLPDDRRYLPRQRQQEGCIHQKQTAEIFRIRAEEALGKQIKDLIWINDLLHADQDKRRTRRRGMNEHASFFVVINIDYR